MTDDQIAGLASDTKTEILERIERTETTLLKEFRKWAVRIEVRGRVMDAAVTGFNERLRVL
jgi:hypothetical protein